LITLREVPKTPRLTDRDRKSRVSASTIMLTLIIGYKPNRCALRGAELLGFGKRFV
jgi:hypothetical protein